MLILHADGLEWGNVERWIYGRRSPGTDYENGRLERNRLQRISWLEVELEKYSSFLSYEILIERVNVWREILRIWVPHVYYSVRISIFKYTYHCDCTKLCSGSGRSPDSIFIIKKEKKKGNSWSEDHCLGNRKIHWIRFVGAKCQIHFLCERSTNILFQRRIKGIELQCFVRKIGTCIVMYNIDWKAWNAFILQRESIKCCWFFFFLFESRERFYVTLFGRKIELKVDYCFSSRLKFNSRRRIWLFLALNISEFLIVGVLCVNYETSKL